MSLPKMVALCAGLPTDLSLGGHPRTILTNSVARADRRKCIGQAVLDGSEDRPGNWKVWIRES